MGELWENAKRRLAHAFRFRCGKSAAKKLFVPAEHLPQELLRPPTFQKPVSTPSHILNMLLLARMTWPTGATMLEHVFSHFGSHLSTRCISLCVCRTGHARQAAGGRWPWDSGCLCVSRSLHTVLEHRTCL